MNDEMNKRAPIALRLLGSAAGGAMLGAFCLVFLDVLFWCVVALLRVVKIVPLSPSGAVIQTEALGSLVLAAGIGLLAGAFGGMWRTFTRD